MRPLAAVCRNPPMISNTKVADTMRFDTLFTNALFRTMDPARPTAKAVGVHGGRIIGLDEELVGLEFRQVHDLAGRTVVPGFHDAHHHLTFVGQTQLQVDLDPSTTASMEALLDKVSAAAAKAPEGAWVIGAGYDQNRLGEHPTAELLDMVSHGHPVYLIHKSRHMGVANTRAFALGGYPERRNLPVPDGGAVPTDEQGRALGLLQETARRIVTDAIPPATAEQVADYAAAGATHAIALGLTSITDPGIGAPDHLGSSTIDLAGYQLARDAGRLHVRATVMPYLTTLHKVDHAQTGGHDHYTLDLGLRSGMGDERLRIGPTKVLSDGSLIGRSAYMRVDYEADALDGCINRGLLQFPEEMLRERLIGAHLAGWQLAIHAIGDAALDVVLDIVAEAQRILPRPDARHRIEHLSVVSDTQIARIVTLGMVAVPQGRFISELGDGVLRALGTQRAALAYRIRSLLDAGIEIPASTDTPVVSGDPLLNIHDLVNRRTFDGVGFGPAESLTVGQALHAYTVGSAYAVHQEHEKGTIAPGMLADLTVLSHDPYAVLADELRNLAVDATIVGGDIVYERTKGRRA